MKSGKVRSSCSPLFEEAPQLGNGGLLGPGAYRSNDCLASVYPSICATGRRATMAVFYCGLALYAYYQMRLAWGGVAIAYRSGPSHEVRQLYIDRSYITEIALVAFTMIFWRDYSEVQKVRGGQSLGAQHPPLVVNLVPFCGGLGSFTPIMDWIFMHHRYRFPNRTSNGAIGTG